MTEFNTNDLVRVTNVYMVVGYNAARLNDIVHRDPNTVFTVHGRCEYPVISNGTTYQCIIIKPEDDSINRHDDTFHVPDGAITHIIQAYTADQWSID